MPNLALVENVNDTQIATVDSEMLARYVVDEQKLTEYREQCKSLSFDTPKQYKEASQVLYSISATRTAVEARRKELKADVLEEGRRIDSCAKYLTAKIREIENPLQAKKDAADDAKRAAKEAEERAKRESFEANLRAAQAAEQARINEERAKLEAEKEEQRKRDEAARVELERVEREQAEERKRLELERAEFEAEKRKAAAAKEAEERRVAAEREARERIERAKRDTQEKAEREAKEAKEAKERAEAAEAARLARIEALKPDADKLADYADRVTDAAVLANGLSFSTTEAEEVYTAALGKILAICNELREFGS